jgi:GTPase SAR1 family protein
MVPLVQVAIVGASGVGKTSYTKHLHEGRGFDPQAKPPATIFFDLTFETNYDVVAAARTVNLRLFDFQGAGDQQQALLRLKALSRHANVVLFFYDVTRRETFEAIRDTWAPQCNDVCLGDPVRILIANKIDCVAEDELKRAVSQEEARALADSIGAAHCYEVSARTSKLAKLKLPLDIALTEWLKREPLPAQTGAALPPAAGTGDCCF